MYKKIADKIQRLEVIEPNPERLKPLHHMMEYIQSKIDKGEDPQLNFICSHNSRRSQMAQIWAQLLADFYGIEVKAFSGGTEVTAFHPNAIAVFEKIGLKIEKEGLENPHYFLFFSEKKAPIEAFSKLYDDAFNPALNYAAVMTCSAAAADCPFIPTAESRISLTYEDPKKFDNSAKRADAYEACSQRIAIELKYVFENLKV